MSVCHLLARALKTFIMIFMQVIPKLALRHDFGFDDRQSKSSSARYRVPFLHRFLRRFHLRHRVPPARITARMLHGIAATSESQRMRTWFLRAQQVGTGRDSRKTHRFPIESKRVTIVRLQADPLKWGSCDCSGGGDGQEFDIA